MSQYLMHRDKRFFLEPQRFNPDRWNNDTRTNLPRFSYFPFGGGPRACIGEPFAWTEGIIAIATIARRWIMKLESISVDGIMYVHHCGKHRSLILIILMSQSRHQE
jgi:cytochrome P450